ncbi:MAG: DUF2235 domain-containing protein [Tepidisphaeraceae bacterium]
MGKRIVFCADGTWDDPQSGTNVVKLYQAIATSAVQVPYYDPGVGTDGTPLQKLTGGALGDGILQKVKDGYAKIAHIYDPGDDVFVFGFSRGAYTARSIAGMIAVSGLPSGSPTDALLDTAFQAYRNRANRPGLLATLNAAGFFDAKIKMVGVWDTVGALGIPAVFGNVDPAEYGFLDTALHPDVLNAYQALAIDERRQEFPPTLWTSAPIAGQTIEQVWFSGVHSDVGGGYPETAPGLSDITLDWMIGKAAALGLAIDTSGPGYPSINAQTSLGPIHESWNPLWLFPRSRTIDPDSSLGNSVAIRVQYERGYEPDNLRYSTGILASTYTIVPVV